MKLYSPFFIFILLLFISCNKERDTYLVENISPIDSLDYYVNLSDSLVLPLEDRREYSDKAYRIALLSADDLKIQKALSHKVSFVFNNFPDSAKQVLEQYKKFVFRAHKNSYIGYYYNQNAFYCDNIIKDKSKAYVYYKKSNQFYQKDLDSIRMCYNFMNIAQIEYYYNNFSESQASATKALMCLRSTKNNNTDIIRELNNLIGLTFSRRNDFDSAIKYYEKAISINEDSISEFILLNNKAHVYQLKKEYTVAIDILEKFSNNKILDSAPVIKAKVLDNLGYAYFSLNKKLGLYYMLSALEIRILTKDKPGLITSYRHLSEYYLDNNPKISKNYAQKTYDLATQENAVDERLQSLKLLQKGSFSQDESDDIFERYTKIDDSIQFLRDGESNKFSKVKYDYSEKEKQVLKAEKTSQSLIFTIIGIIVAFLFLYLIIRIYHKKEKLKESYKTETRIAKKVHDELANDMYNVMTFADSQDLSLPDQKEKLVATLDNVYSRTRDISRQNSSIETGHKYAENLKEMLSEYKNNITNVLINGLDDIDWTEIDENKKVIIYRVLQELMVNMKKHSQATLCMLLFKKSSKKIEINYSDNGIGIDLEKLIYKNGLANTETRIKSIKGNITFVSTPDKGFKISFNFPI